MLNEAAQMRADLAAKRAAEQSKFMKRFENKRKPYNALFVEKESEDMTIVELC